MNIKTFFNKKKKQCEIPNIAVCSHKDINTARVVNESIKKPE